MSSWLEVGGVLGLVAAAGYWLDAMRSKELARAAGKRACEQAQVQFLDDTVELVRVRMRRDGYGRLGWKRDYQFEFSDDGAFRRRGELTVFGGRVLHVALEPHRFTGRLP